MNSKHNFLADHINGLDFIGAEARVMGRDTPCGARYHQWLVCEELTRDRCQTNPLNSTSILNFYHLLILLKVAIICSGLYTFHTDKNSNHSLMLATSTEITN